ncbi:hypothetical protein B0T16DRAFT_316274 [Cercophora newfieldiana]|uniref:Uncharacterized protein n=1 Tax=Cercophora newfieldiana TaxID=92897 RepID=A0AA40D014_9PEZI|nr:hypothetical protein B0T16DRAFT_316274 [Cercophora newfieldiana]
MATAALINQAPINLGPLTTTFTPPPACTVAVGVVEGGLLGIGGSVESIAALGQVCAGGKGVDATSCWPPTSRGAPSKSAPLNGWGYYSPGIHCPVGYATACSATGGTAGASNWPVQFRLSAGETAVGCCPNGYACDNKGGQTCVLVATSTVVPMVTCDGSKSGDFAFKTVPDAKASVTAFSLFAPMFQLNWQSSDRPATTRPTAGPGATRTNTNDPAVTSGTQTVDPNDASGLPTLETDGSSPRPSGEPDATGISDGLNGSDAEKKEEDASANTGLATTTKVGLSIAGAVVAVAIIVGCVMYVWRRRRHQREDQELDRLYGMKHSPSSSTDLTRGGDDIPGWYRGQRPVQTPSQFTPTTLSPYRAAPSPGLGGGRTELEVPASPYYRPYRP